ncbi:MAG: phosphoribosyltransferase [Promethearchaeota archaeon CR_4]|nr:MAG: phosphoribosyltransferase [Candidatus Lokiarchaeota archaeon CR_4]
MTLMPLDNVINKLLKCNDTLYLPWDMDFIEKISGKIGKDILEACIKQQNELPGIIIGMGKGGEYPTELIRKELGINDKLFLTVSHSGIGEQKKVEIAQDLEGSVANKYVLLVDDVANGGRTITFVKKYLEGEGKGARGVITVTLACKQKKVFKPDFYGAETSGWIIFPWEEEIKELITESYKKGNFDTIRKIFTKEEIESAIGKDKI